MLKIINKFHSSPGNFPHILAHYQKSWDYSKWCVAFQHILKWNIPNKLHSLQDQSLALRRRVSTHSIVSVLISRNNAINSKCFYALIIKHGNPSTQVKQTTFQVISLSLSLWYLICVLTQKISLHTCLWPAQLQTNFHDISLSLSSKVLLARTHRIGIVCDSRRLED